MKFHLIIGTKDADIAYWMASLPKGCVSHYLVVILQAEIKKKIAILPVPEEPGLLEHTTHITIYFKSKQIEELLANVKKGKKGNYVKKIIRKHLGVNYRKATLKKQDDVRSEVVVTEENNEEKLLVSEANELVDQTVEVPEDKKSNVTENPGNDFKARMMRMTNR